MAPYGGNYQRGGGGNYGGNRGGGGQQNYPNSGALFSQQKKSQNSPDMTGNVVVSEDVLDYILNHANQGEVKLEISGWRRQAQSGTNFVSLKINIPYAERQQENPQYRPQNNYQRRPPQGEREERAQYGPPQRQAPNAYAQQSGRYQTAPQRQAPQGPSQEEFERGDRMPDFMRDQDEIPFP
jgi:hypothetical protein